MKKINTCSWVLAFFSFLNFFMSMEGRAEVKHWNEGRGYRPFGYAIADGIDINNTTDTLEYSHCKLGFATDNLELTFRARNQHGKPSKRYSYRNRYGKTNSIANPHWGFYLTGLKDTLVFIVRNGEEFSQLESKGCVDLTMYDLWRKEKRELQIKENIHPYQGENLWKVLVNNGEIEVYCGHRSLEHVLSYSNKIRVTGFGFIAGWGDRVKISDITARYVSKEDNSGTKANLYEIIPQTDVSDDELEGYWTLFDRELDESLLKLGGNYTLLCVKDDDKYKFYYIEGAKVNSKGWEEGDLKAVLTPTVFQGIYDVEWIDAMKEPMKKDIKAQHGEGNTLQFQFPYQTSSFRLRKLPPK